MLIELIKVRDDLFHFAQLIDVTLVTLHAVFRQMKIRRVVAQLLLVLRHFLDHLRQVFHGRLIANRRLFLAFDEFLHAQWNLPAKHIQR